MAIIYTSIRPNKAREYAPLPKPVPNQYGLFEQVVDGVTYICKYDINGKIVVVTKS